MNDFRELIFKAVKGDGDAAAFFLSILRIVDTWDALVDFDENVPEKRIHQAFMDCLITLPNNPFYAKWRATMEPLIVAAIVSWRAATIAERRDKAGREWAFAVRSNYVDLLIMAAVVIGGVEWGVEMALEIRAYVAREGFEGYIAALTREVLAREVRINGLL